MSATGTYAKSKYKTPRGLKIASSVEEVGSCINFLKQQFDLGEDGRWDEFASNLVSKLFLYVGKVEGVVSIKVYERRFLVEVPLAASDTAMTSMFDLVIKFCMMNGFLFLVVSSMLNTADFWARFGLRIILAVRPQDSSPDLIVHLMWRTSRSGSKAPRSVQRSMGQIYSED